MALQDRRTASISARGSSAKPRHLRAQAGVIDEDEARWVEVELAVKAPIGPVTTFREGPKTRKYVAEVPPLAIEELEDGSADEEFDDHSEEPETETAPTVMALRSQVKKADHRPSQKIRRAACWPFLLSRFRIDFQRRKRRLEKSIVHSGESEFWNCESSDSNVFRVANTLR
ncbi:hypothetical protein J3A65_000927 [Rhizobium sp. PvP014]|nr:hypothetical protein [Rhizobium sp. PvP014]MBP2531536.1 hypothetical protein [Rhizobium sp. PvP099]